MFIKNTFGLFVLSAAMTVSSVSAGGVRGVNREDGVGMNRGRRHLKSEHTMKYEVKRERETVDQETLQIIEPQPFPTTNLEPVIPPNPDVPRTDIATWLGNCNTQRLQQCIGPSGLETCTQCLYAQSLISSPGQTGIKYCAKFMCNDCESNAFDFFDCGIESANAPPLGSSPGVPAPAPTEPVVTLPPIDENVPDIESSTTSEGCPLVLPETGASCNGMIPAPFIYHKCYYRDYICSCRFDSPYYVCTERPPATPAPTPVVITQSPTIAQTVCSDEIRSGTQCTTAGLDCCVGEQSRCICGSDNFFVCQTSDNCGAEEEPVAVDPVEIPEFPGSVPIPAEVDFSMSTTWCPVNITNCDPCGEFLPENAIGGSCMARNVDISYMGTGYIADIQCSCFTDENPDPTWDCNYVGGNLGNVTVPLDPLCSGNETIVTIVDPIPVTPTEPVEETPADPVVEPVDETPVEPVDETPAEPVVEPVEETPAEPVEETPAEPVVVPVAETPAEPVVEPVGQTPIVSVPEPEVPEVLPAN